MISAHTPSRISVRRGPRRSLVTLPLLVATLLLIVACGRNGPEADAGEAGGAGEAGVPSEPVQAASVAPSFDCAAASGEVEELICSNAELAALDLRLDSIWREVETQLGSGSWPESEQEVVRAEQRGWIGGRNDCWKAADPRACTGEQYERRIVTLQAAFGLVEGGEPTFWGCEGNPANEFVLTFFTTNPGSVRVERGDRQEVMVQTPAASGARYLGDFGKEVWVRGEEGTFVWPQEDTLRCVLSTQR